ncbi:MAG: maleate cis-trans isomerase family protein [Gaiellales bacterium]
MTIRRIGMIVPSSNTTMETELPEMFRWRAAETGETFTWHSARAQMSHVTPEELDRMVKASDVAARALADAPIEVIAYACLVAVMCRGAGAHCSVRDQLEAALVDGPRQVPVISSAGALVDTLQALDAQRVALVTPYMRPLAEQVSAYIEGEGFAVSELVALEVSDNVKVGQLDPGNLIDIGKQVASSGADVIVLSACVQMPSLPAVQAVEDAVGLPVITAATATARAILLALGLDPRVPNAGRALAGDLVASVAG